MYKRLLLATTCAFIGATGAQALEFTGGTIGFSYTVYPDTDELTETSFQSSVEFAVNPTFSVALEIANSNLDVDGAPISYNSSTTIVHGIYGVSDTLDVGGYVGRNNIFYYETNSFGVEASYDGGNFDVSGSLGVMDMTLAPDNFITAGIRGNYGFGNGFSMGAGVDLVDYQGSDFQAVTPTIRGEYDFGNGMSAYLTAGQLRRSDGSGTETEDFIVVGTTFSFGPEGGTTFETPKSSELFFFGI